MAKESSHLTPLESLLFVNESREIAVWLKQKLKKEIIKKLDAIVKVVFLFIPFKINRNT